MQTDVKNSCACSLLFCMEIDPRVCAYAKQLTVTLNIVICFAKYTEQTNLIHALKLIFYSTYPSTPIRVSDPVSTSVSPQQMCCIKMAVWKS